jgi:hypothetical protein
VAAFADELARLIGPFHRKNPEGLGGRLCQPAQRSALLDDRGKGVKAAAFKGFLPGDIVAERARPPDFCYVAAQRGAGRRRQGGTHD